MLCVDATAGHGRDTLLLCRLVGERGRVLAFDIQAQALESTRCLLAEHGMLVRAQLIRDSHSNLEKYLKDEELIYAAVFNLGYLPGGNHSLFTRADTTIAALEKILRRLPSCGFVAVCVYYGGDSGFDEHDAVLAYLKTIDPHLYTVMLHDFCNRPNCPPLFVVIEKH